MSKRIDIPDKLKRQILLEAGHRCAIPTCRFPTTEIAHIEPYSKVKKHEYRNLIALCPNCHTRFDKDEIDKKSMLSYKKKIAFLSDRYSKFELNVLDYLRSNEAVAVYGYLMVKNLLDEGLIEKRDIICSYSNEDEFPGEIECEIVIKLTDGGKEFLKDWEDAEKDIYSYD